MSKIEIVKKQKTLRHIQNRIIHLGQIANMFISPPEGFPKTLLAAFANRIFNMTTITEKLDSRFITSNKQVKQFIFRINPKFYKVTSLAKIRKKTQAESPVTVV